jgi:hypothetical protein
MDLTGRYVGFWMHETDVRAAFGPSAAGPRNQRWSIVGTVEGETSNVGFWLIPIVAEAENGERLGLRAEPIASVLIRWSAVLGMIVWDKNVTTPPKTFGYITPAK